MLQAARRKAARKQAAQQLQKQQEAGSRSRSAAAAVILRPQPQRQQQEREGRHLFYGKGTDGTAAGRPLERSKMDSKLWSGVSLWESGARRTVHSEPSTGTFTGRNKANKSETP